MICKYCYHTPPAFSDLWMNGDDTCLTGLWFEGSKDTAKHVTECGERLTPALEDTVRWLDLYFDGKRPNFMPKLRIQDLTPFRREVLELLLEIPYGETVTYGALAERLAVTHGIPRMSAQAVGGAVGWNPVCIIIPCHRVMGANRALTGYGGGLQNKIALLELEKGNMR